jgi:hypothetical protein
MSPHRALFVVTAVIVTLAAGFTLKERLARNATDRAAAEAQGRRLELAAKARRLQATISAEEKNLADAQHVLAELRVRSAKLAPAPKKDGPPSLNDRVREAGLHDPKFQNLELAAGRIGLTPLYGALFEQLGLTVERADRLRDLLAKRGERNSDVAAVAASQGLKGNDPALARLRQESDAEFAGEVRALLGEAGFQVFQGYERSIEARNFISEFAGWAPILTAPLAADQAEQLTAALAQTSLEYQTGGRVSLLNIDWPAAMAAAAKILSEEQLAVFKIGAARNRVRQELRDLVRRNSASRP